MLDASPVISSVSPPVLTDRVGDHIAFVATASGTGSLSYQWYQNSTLLSGQTSATLVVTNVQTGSAGSYWVAVTDTTGTSSNFSTLNVSTAYLPLYSTNLILARVGDGAQPLSQATGNTMYLDEYTTSGAYVSTIQVPDEVPANVGSPGPALLISGGGSDAVYEGLLSLSGNNQFLTFAGYNTPFPNATSDVTLTGAHFRGLAGVNSFGYYALAYTNAGLYSGGNHTIRGTVTDGLTNYWVSGQAGAGGIKFINAPTTSYAGGSGIPVVNSSGTGVHIAEIVPDNLTDSETTLIYADSLGASGSGLYTANGLPQPAPSGTAASALFFATGSGSQPNDFAFSPDGLTAYVTDDRPFVNSTTQAGGIERWDYSGGTWTFSYTLGTSGATNGTRGLTADFSAHTSWGPGVTGASLYAVSASAITNTLFRVVDTGSSSAPATVIATAGPNQLLEGVRFGPPVPAPAAISSQPQNQFVLLGSNAVFTVTGLPTAGPFTYQWYEGTAKLANGLTGTGSTILGATTSTLTVSNISVSDLGSYSVVVSNPGSSVTSSPVVLDQAIDITQQPTDQYISAGATATFSVTATGHGTLSYQWFENGSPLTDVAGQVSGSQTPTLSIENAQDANIAGYSVAITDSTVASNMSASAYLELATPGNGTGLLGQYWSNQMETNGAASAFQGPPTLTRIDPDIDFTYAVWANGVAGISLNNFAVIWSGQVQPLYTDNYLFTALTDDGVRLFVDGQEIVNNWIKQGAVAVSGGIALNAGQKYSIVMQYFNGAFPAEAELSWSGTYEPMRIIPQSQLYPAAPPSFLSEPVAYVYVNENGPIFINGGSLSGTSPFTYQWYTNGVAMPGQTNIDFELSSIPIALNNGTLTLVVDNAFGAQTNSGTLVSISSGFPERNTDIQATSTVVGAPVVFNVSVSGTEPVYQWTENGTNLTDNSRVFGSQSNVLTIAQAFESDSGTYQLFWTNSYGNSSSSAAPLTVTRIELDNGGGWETNGSGSIVGGVYTLTDSNLNEASSGWVNFPLYIGAFQASWIYQDVGAGNGSTTADGYSFALQTTGPTALGGNGDNIGISGISPSWEMEFNIYSGTRGGVGIAFDTNGLTGAVLGAGGVVGNPFSSTAPVDISSGDPIEVNVEYLDDLLTVTLTDKSTAASYTTTQTVNLPAILGTNMAYIGLTGGTDGTYSSLQTVSNFLFSPLPELSVQADGQDTLVWWPEGPAPGFVLQETPSLSSTNWVDVTTAPTLTNGIYEVVVPKASTENFYRLTLP
jgi:hypothetical protein